MTITELIEKLNTYCDEHNICDLEYIDNDLYEELKNLNFRYITSVNSDECRWYIVSENVYEVTIDEKKYYIGAWEVSSIKSECMSVKDCEVKLRFFEMEEYTTVSYRKKK